MSDTKFTVTKGVDLGSPRACCLVSSLDIRPLRPKRLQLISAGLTDRYQLLNPGERS